MSDDAPILHREADQLIPTGHARGPWDPGQQHGGVPAALIATEVQALAPEMQVARITYDFLGVVPLEPLTVEAQIVKPGRRFQLAEATLSASGRPAVVARAALLRREEIDPPPIARRAEGLPGDGPQAAAERPFSSGTSNEDEGFHLTGMTIRFADGTSFDEPGPAHAWFRLGRDLIGGEPVVPVARAVAAADFGNGVSSVLDWGKWLFINCDLTVSLQRDPVGEWVLLDARTHIATSGIGWAASTLYDERGPIGFSQQTLFVAPR